jgi:dTDP-4-dehydrorhamnose reductase
MGKIRIAVIGASGMLGSDICRVFSDRGCEVRELTHEMVEITDSKSISGVLGHARADLIINTAAFHHVPKCESDPVKAFAVNALGAKNLAVFCQDNGVPLIHIGTDYVFDGRKEAPYVETDTPHPLNTYGNTKLSGEHYIEALCEKHYIVRVSGIYGKNLCRAKGGNFVTTMLKFAKQDKPIRVVDDEILTPTFTEDVAAQIFFLYDKGGEYGLYHVTAEGSCSWYRFAEEIFTRVGMEVDLSPAAPGEFDGDVQRPKYCVLENKNLKDQHLNIMPDWRDGLGRFLSSNHAIS